MHTPTGFMMGSIRDLWQANPSYRILAALVLLYIAARAALDATMEMRASTAGRFAWTMALPIGLTSAVAVMMQRTDVAIGLLFATSVAALSLTVGLCAFLAPAGEVPGAARRVWTFLIPLAMLAVVAGFTGQLTLTHAAIFALQGGFIYYVRTDPIAALEDDPVPALLEVNEPPPRITRPWRVAELVLAGVVVLIAAYLLIASASVSLSPLARFGDSLLAVGILSPILLLPMVGLGAAMAQRGRTIATAHASVLLTVVNLCVLLPLIIGLYYLRPTLAWLAHRTMGLETAAATAGGTAPWLGIDPPTFPLSAWRIDSIVLLILAIAALPVATNRLPLGRREGVALIVLYTVYLVANALLGTRY